MAELRQQDYLSHYWGKADPNHEGAQKWHPLAYHSLDVSAVGVEYLRQSTLLNTMCQSLKCSAEQALAWMAFCLALHDLGKFSEAFQSQRSDLVLTLQERQPNPTKIYSQRHDSLGFWLWEELVSDSLLAQIGIDASRRTERGLACWLRAVTGHHGMPPIPSGSTENFFRREDRLAAKNFVRAMAGLLLTAKSAQIPTMREGSSFQQSSELLSWWIAGVTVLADWLGSNTQFFRYEEPTVALDEYWAIAQARAKVALNRTGVLASGVEQERSFQELFPKIQVRSPLQDWAQSVEITQTPQLYILEDVTGAGKTEAAIMLAYRLMQNGLAEGFFVGLPTMATANAMYRRVAEVYARLFTGDANLVLAHGNKKLVEEFAASVLPHTIPEQDVAQHDESASARCTAWLADHSKRALLASAGIGTIDQALLAVLHSKHQSLRLLGLFNKVLIVDEVHACDAYMQGVLEVLLAFHARTGGPVILLSATLPAGMKQALLDAYARGRNQATAPQLQSSAFPLATCWRDGQTALAEVALGSRSCVSRTVKVHYEADAEIVFGHILSALQQGQCVAWIRNTVADAMAAFEHLARFVAPEKITLFHARFTLRDRLDKEALVLSSFGEQSAHDDRAGRLVIATQVAEQSLDVDFDVLITDLAPVDRILQRAGRLHRHVRDVDGNRLRANDAKDGRNPPCMWVFAPAWTEEPSANWFRDVFKKAQYVYPHHGQLWLTAKALQRDSFTMPADARTLIEAVFSTSVSLPEALTKNAMKAEGQDMSEASLAQLNTLKLDGGYKRGEVLDWWSDSKSPSRLGEETTEVMLAKWVDGQLRRWSDGPWPYSMVKVASRLLASVEMPADGVQQAAYRQLQQSLPSEGKWCVLLPLTHRPDGAWKGSAWTAGNEKANKKPELLVWLYDAEFGLRLAKPEDGETTK
jgi:CRISPR-associated endonuclease/helicase Cas3